MLTRTQKYPNMGENQGAWHPTGDRGAVLAAGRRTRHSKDAACVCAKGKRHRAKQNTPLSWIQTGDWPGGSGQRRTWRSLCGPRAACLFTSSTPRRELGTRDSSVARFGNTTPSPDAVASLVGAPMERGDAPLEIPSAELCDSRGDARAQASSSARNGPKSAARAWGFPGGCGV